MLLTEYPQLKLEINNLKINFKFNFNTINNLYYGLKDKVICKKLKIKSITPLQLLEESQGEFNKGYFMLLIHSAVDGNITLDEISDTLNEIDNETLKNINYMFNTVIIQSLVYIDKSEKNNNENKNIKNDFNEETEEIFEDWFNYFYTMSIDKLKLTTDDFLKSTPAQIKERVNRVNIDLKNIQLSCIPNIIGEKEESNVKVEEVNDIRDFANMI